MNIFKRDVDDNWFYEEPDIISKIFLVFVKGDALIIIPFFLILILLFFINKNFGIICGITFWSFRYLGETFYWFLRQFSKPDYRPYDFGLKKLNNNSIYILYQLATMAAATLGFSFLIYFIKYI